MAELDEIVQEFLVESAENLDVYDRELLALERDPSAQEPLASAFRALHTVKGTCGFLGFTNLEALAHAGETLLGRLRDGTLVLTPPIATALLRAGDDMRRMLATIETAGSDDGVAAPALTAELISLSEGAGIEAPTQPEPVLTEPADAQAEDPGDTDPGDRDAAAQATEVVGAEVAQARDADAEPEIAAAVMVADVPQQGQSEPAESTSGPTRATESTVRVEVGLLDRLMNLVGELVLARNQILQRTSVVDDAVLLAGAQRLNLVTTELQEGVMKTRMQPIGGAWSRLPRLARDVATQKGKRIRVVMTGQETELDKAILEAIRDPLTHVVRNAVDHGMESPEEREKAGKNPEGTLHLRAYHEGGQVTIEIADDGRGIDPARVAEKALERGLVSRESLASMSEAEIVRLVFRPGFSTAAEVTATSGRGVGMDVVQTNVEKAGGSVDLDSRLGVGTTVRIKIPLTLAIIPALIVECGGDCYAIPQASLLELVRLDAEQAARDIDQILDSPVYRLRGDLLPLVFLARELGIEPAPPSGDEDATNIVVLQADGGIFGLVVDRIADTEEIVVKPLGRQLQGLRAFAGTTVMGDGRVALILDVVGLAQRARISTGQAAERVRATDPDERRDQRQTLLVCEAGGRRVAVPLALVTRLEEFSREAVESAAGMDVVQYRGRLLPLIRVAEHLAGSAPQEATGPIAAIVHEADGREVGLVVDRIVDIVEEEIDPEAGLEVAGIPLAGIVGRRATDLLNIDALLRRGTADVPVLEGSRTHG